MCSVYYRTIFVNLFVASVMMVVMMFLSFLHHKFKKLCFKIAVSFESIKDLFTCYLIKRCCYDSRLLIMAANKLNSLFNLRLYPGKADPRRKLFLRSNHPLSRKEHKREKNRCQGRHQPFHFDLFILSSIFLTIPSESAAIELRDISVIKAASVSFSEYFLISPIILSTLSRSKDIAHSRSASQASSNSDAVMGFRP